MISGGWGHLKVDGINKMRWKGSMSIAGQDNAFEV
jgi:hypothetical protein